MSNSQLKCDLAYKEKEALKKNVFELMLKVYGAEITNKVSQRTIWVGMPVELLFVAKGRPAEMKENIYKNKVVDKWYYGKYTNRLGNTKYELEIIIENDIIVGWKDLI
ncbi:hypothetical protein ACO2Q8_05260 [Larkinella sp. VNQ87]|uniref:hypothetical protein n=1 Tax=Larkinella sp. VNQ87 TaxID=3400921 RepID=UPI003C0012B6